MCWNSDERVLRRLESQQEDGRGAQGARGADELEACRAELREARQLLRGLSSQLISIQEQERARIARELHDGTGQALTVLRMQLEAMLKTPSQGSTRKCIAMVDRALEHTRRLVLDLGPAMLEDLSLADALEWTLQEQAEVAGWRTAFHAEERGRRFPAEVETACLRIAQEALANAARHAGASEVSVSVGAGAEGLVLQLTDDGRGFELERSVCAEARRRHFGLVSMSERARVAGGRLEIHTAPGEGTRIRVSFPVD